MPLEFGAECSHLSSSEFFLSTITITITITWDSFSCTTIDWFSAWPEEALLSVSTRFFADLELPSDEVRKALSDMCVVIHTSVQESADTFFNQLRRKIYTTPKSYLDLISLYLNMLEQKRTQLNVSHWRLVMVMVMEAKQMQILIWIGVGVGVGCEGVGMVPLMANAAEMGWGWGWGWDGMGWGWGWDEDETKGWRWCACDHWNAQLYRAIVLVSKEVYTS